MARPVTAHTIALLSHPPRLSPAWAPRLREAGFHIEAIAAAETLWTAADARPRYAACLLWLADAQDEAVAALPLLARDAERPVLVLLAHGTAFDRAALLEAGAADVIGPEIRPVELAARLRARLRERRGATAAGGSAAPLFAAGCSIEASSRTVRRGDGCPLSLSAAEFDLLLALAQTPGRVWSRRALLQAAGRPEWAVGGRSIDVLIGRLRRKLGDSAERPRWIETVRGRGYRLNIEPVRAAVFRAVPRSATAD